MTNNNCFLCLEQSLISTALICYELYTVLCRKWKVVKKSLVFIYLLAVGVTLKGEGGQETENIITWSITNENIPYH